MCQSNTVESIPPGGSLDRQRLITAGFKPPEGMFTFLSNRASTSFAEALIPLGGRVYEPGNTHIDFCYWNSYSGETLPQDVTLGFSLLNRQRTIPLDNKKLLAQRLMLLGLCNPPVYTDPEDIPGNAEGLPGPCCERYPEDRRSAADRRARRLGLECALRRRRNGLRRTVVCPEGG